MEAEPSTESIEQSKDSVENDSVSNNMEDTEQSVEKPVKNSEVSVQNSDEGTGPFHEIEDEANKDSYETEFEKFLRQANERTEESEASVGDNSREVSSEDFKVQKTAPVFEPTGEDTSNSSWYKMKSGSEIKMDTSENVTPPDESSNLSVPDNGSVASSNIGDSCMSYQDQASNMDEESNMSIPEESSVPKYTGHQPVFDESANMNPPSNVGFARPDTPNRPDTPSRPDTPGRPDTPSRPDTPGSTIDPNSESTPVKRYRRGTLQIAAEDASEHGHGITARDIFEYQWPQEKDSEYFMLQEQISMYLDVKSFKRKYPDLFRRVCDKREKDFLRDKGVVSETQSDLGLTALKADEVHDLMSRDYPAKYKEFLKVLREREKQKMADKMKEFHALKLEKDKMVEYTKKAMRSVSEWNRSLLKKKNEERRAYFDMQTFTIQYPKSKFRKLDHSQTEVSAYPLSLIPGQFQDHYRKYTQEELKYFPLNTALFDPPKKVDASAEHEVDDDDDDDSQADDKGNDSSDSDDSSSSSSDDDDDDDEDDDGEAGDNEGTKKARKEKSTSRETSKEKSAEPSIKQENECRICKDEPAEKQKDTEHEELIICSECKSKGHPTCLDLNKDMVRVIKTYPWQCMECKTCVQCMDPYDEDKMLFCDKCDRGYHTFCVGLKSLPAGQWDCFSCRGDTTPIKPLPRPTPKAKRGRKPGRPPGRPGRPPGRPPKDPNKVQDTPGKDPYRRETPGRDRRRRLREEIENTSSKEGGLESAVKDEPVNGNSVNQNEESKEKTMEIEEQSDLEERKSNDQDIAEAK
ncbi:PHD finger protein 10-like [Mercenaria mercenaria]|uniref:PHD finger protein 10-like n=1 Tax=Mercenaria mercenaria TaxID=6596 RepID=UPI00234F3C19|nr:PHD finger protein 10-like [Mercenaria mercenaria]